MGDTWIFEIKKDVSKAKSQVKTMIIFALVLLLIRQSNAQ